MRRSPLLFAVLVPLLAACSGGDGDPPSKPLADEFGSCSRLSKIQGEPTWLDPKDPTSTHCALPPDRNVCISGLTILAIDRFDETSDGKAAGNYYVQDTSADPLPYSGITIFRPSFSPPDLRLAVGDVVDFLGTHQEFNGPTTFMFNNCRTLPELSGALSFRFDHNLPVVPKVIPLADLKAYETGRPYIGTLVKIENVKLDGNGGGNSSGRYTSGLDVGGIANAADVPRVTNELYDIETEGPMLPAEASFKSITGVVTFFGGLHIAPRSPADFEP